MIQGRLACSLRKDDTQIHEGFHIFKHSLEGISSRINEAEERISDVEDKIVEITTTEKNKEKRMKRIEDSLRDLWDNIKHTNS